MREIIFRGKRIDNGKWTYGKNFLYDPDAYKVWIGGYDYSTAEAGYYRKKRCYEVAPRTVGQYLGMVDECGSSVFEGDIIELESDEGVYYIVSWDNNAIQYVLEGKDESIMFEPIGCGFTVVGNVFDNPDMADW